LQKQLVKFFALLGVDLSPKSFISTDWIVSHPETLNLELKRMGLDPELINNHHYSPRAQQ
jgi:hypothetical protein